MLTEEELKVFRLFTAALDNEVSNEICDRDLYDVTDDDRGEIKARLLKRIFALAAVK